MVGCEAEEACPPPDGEMDCRLVKCRSPPECLVGEKRVGGNKCCGGDCVDEATCRFETVGVNVPVGWSGYSLETLNYCNNCHCFEGGVLPCTEMACPPVTGCVFFEAGIQVEVGWTGSSLDKSNSCNSCSCVAGETEGEGGVLACTRMLCSDGTELMGMLSASEKGAAGKFGISFPGGVMNVIALVLYSFWW